MEEVGAEEELSAGQGQAGQEVSAGLEEPDGGWRSPGLEGCCLADGGGRRSVFKRGVFLYFCAFSPGRRGTPNDNYFGTKGVYLSEHEPQYK